MKRRYLVRASSSLLTLLALSLWIACTAGASAQPQGQLSIPPTPCDSVYCDSLPFRNAATSAVQVEQVVWRDKHNFTTDLTLPLVIPAGDSLGIPVCFRPDRRGKITDSLLLVVRGPNGLDSFYARVTGTGIGPELDASPIVLNFPKTAVSSPVQLSMWIRNNGERPYDLTSTALVIPPPFKLLTTLPLLIPPMDSVMITIEFLPTERGIYSFPVDIPAGCTRTLEIGLNGATDLIGTGAVIRSTKFLFNPVNNEQTPCDVTQCTDLTISNVGNAPLSIDSIAWALDTLGYQLVPQPAVPFYIQPNSERTLHVCLNSRRRGTLRDTLVLVNNNRNPIAFGMVMDVSGSMDFSLDCGSTTTKRITQAIIQGQNFIGKTLLYIPSISLQDQIAISTYTTTTATRGAPPLITHIFPLTWVTDPVRTSAQSSLSGLTARGGTPTGAALLRMMDTLAKSPLENRVIVLLTDGDADDTTTTATKAPALAASAAKRGIRIFSIGIGLDAMGKRYLSTLASGTGGATFDASNCDSLQDAFERITDIISRGSIHREPFSMTVTAPALVTSSPIKFDSTLVGVDTCTTITLTNVGEGAAQINDVGDLTFTDDMGNPVTDFRVREGTVFPIKIDEADHATIDICFKPTAIRMRNAVVHVKYNNCGDDRLAPELQGPGYAYANLRVNDQRVGLPGDVVTMPIYADSSLNTYGVGTIVYRITWDATMLDLRGVSPGAITTSAGGTVNLSGPVSIVNGRATAEIKATGGQFAGPGELASLEFEVLRGDSLGSRVELTSGTFEDGNPRAKLANAGIIAYDSTCFRSSKPLSYLPPGSKVSAGELTPTPTAGGKVILPLDASADARVDVTLYNTGGTITSEPRSQIISAGHTDLPIAVDTLPPGDYYVVIHTNAGETLLRKLTIVR